MIIQNNNMIIVFSQERHLFISIFLNGVAKKDPTQPRPQLKLF